MYTVCPLSCKDSRDRSLSSIDRFQYKIALPAPALYGQFKDVTDINDILYALKGLGFDYVYEVARELIIL